MWLEGSTQPSATEHDLYIKIFENHLLADPFQCMLGQKTGSERFVASYVKKVITLSQVLSCPSTKDVHSDHMLDMVGHGLEYSKWGTYSSLFPGVKELVPSSAWSVAPAIVNGQ